MLLHHCGALANAEAVCTVGLVGETQVRRIVGIWLRLSCLLVIAGRAATADTVTLTNGDKLTCDIKKLEEGELTVAVGYADDTELTFAWEMVSSITSETALKVQLEDGRELTAKLQTPERAGQLLPQGSAAPLALNRVISLKPAEEPEVPWTDNLSLDNDLSFGYTGNNGLHTVSWYTQSFYWGEKWEFAVLGSQNTNRYRGQPNSYNQIQGQANVNRYLTEHLFVFPWAAGLHVTETRGGHGSIWQLGGGAGWSFIKKKDHHLQLFEGVIDLREQATVPLPFASQPSLSLNSDSPALLTALRWQKTTGEGITLVTQALYTYPFEGHMRKQLGLLSSFSIPIAGPVSADVNVQDNTSPLSSGLLSLKSLSVSIGFGLHR